MLLYAPIDFAVNLSLTIMSLNAGNWYDEGLKVGSTGTYRPGVCVLDCEVNECDYFLLPSTFKQGQHGAFRLQIQSPCRVNVQRIV